MPERYQNVYPSAPLLDSASLVRPSAAGLLTLEYFEAEPAQMPAEVYEQHHVLLNLKEEPHRVENWRDGEHLDYIFSKDEVVITPAGMSSGWRWYERSKVIVITLEPAQLETFAQTELGVLLTGEQLKDQSQFLDPDLCAAGGMIHDALSGGGLGSQVLFESLARVFLVKLVERYGQQSVEEFDFSRRFSAKHYERVLAHVAAHYGRSLSLDELAEQASLSSSHFSRLFKQTVGQSPMQFVTAYRIEQAKKRLLPGSEPLISVALGCGFADQAHFSRVFKQATGMTPAEFQRAG